MTVTDSQGRLWFYGGAGYDEDGRFGTLGDLWYLDLNSGFWHYVKGHKKVKQPAVLGTKGVYDAANKPPALPYPAIWIDQNDNIWLFAGGFEGEHYNTMWQFNTTLMQWRWVGGTNTKNHTGTYGTKGQSSSSYLPSSRRNPATWVDESGNLWLYGGRGINASGQQGNVSDMWRFNPVTEEWTWIAGSKDVDESASYGNKGVAAAGNTPGGRYWSPAWVDSRGDFWMFGGCLNIPGVFNGTFNDTWKFDRSTNQWVWMHGQQGINQPGSYGTVGIPSPSNCPTPRRIKWAWETGPDEIITFGAWGYENGANYVRSDLWRCDVSGGSTGKYPKWRQLSTSNDPPMTGLGYPSGVTVPVFDEAANTIHLIQRSNGTLWSLDLSTGVWSSTSTTNQPAWIDEHPRDSYGLHFDNANNRLIMWHSGYYMTAELDLASLQWNELTSARITDAYAGGIAHDTKRDRIVTFGGYGGGSFKNVLRYFDYSTSKWVSLPASGDIPPPTAGASLAYEPSMDAFFMIGGNGAGNFNNNGIYSYTVSNGKWTKLLDTSHTRYWANNYLVRYRGDFYTVGGRLVDSRGNPSASYTNEAYTFSSTAPQNYNLLPVEQPKPQPFLAARVFSDTARKRLIAFGLHYNLDHTYPSSKEIWFLEFEDHVATPGIEVTEPNGGETWVVGTTQTVTWTSDNISTVAIDYSTDDGTSWLPVVSSVPASGGSYQWSVPATPSTQCRIRISSAVDPTVSDMSDAVFTIEQPGGLTLLRPNGGEVFTVGDTEAIQWSGTVTGKVDLFFSTDNGATWNQAATGVDAASGSYAWTVPNAPSTECFMRVRSEDDPSVLDVSDAAFTIEAPAPEITVVEPNGGEVLTAGNSFTLQWYAPATTLLTIDYSFNGGGSWERIADSVDATTGQMAWTVPSTPSTDCLLRIRDVTDPALEDVSDGYFEIRILRDLRVIRPNGGEVWYVSDTNRISWQSSGIAEVSLEYSTDDGASWAVVRQAVPASAGRHDWVIPDTPSKQCRVRVTATDDGSLTDISNAMFEISRRPELVLIAPDGGERWMVGSRENIRWTASSVSYVNLDFSSDAGLSWTRIAERFPAFRQTLIWDVPEVVSTQCLVRLTDVDGHAEDVSDAVFEIYDAPLRVVTPNGGEMWDVGASRYITWTSRGVQRIRIDYSHDRGRSWVNVARSVPAGDGKYAWDIPDTPSDTCYVLLRDEDNTGVSDMSNGVFEIRRPPNIEVLTPNGPEVWRIGTSRLITWNSFNVDEVRIEYSYDDMQSWEEIAGPVPAEKRSWDWLIPNHPSDVCYVRISDYDDASVFDISDAQFGIVPNKSVTLTTPDGGEKIEAGSTFSIQWTSVNVARVLLEYSSDNGSTWTEIADNVSSTGIYAWAVPSELTLQGRIRITDVDDELIFDVSQGSFEITTPTDIGGGIPDRTFAMHQNYPNPFNPETTIPFVIPAAGHVRIAVYDAFGRELSTLADARFTAGLHRVIFSAGEHPSGIYLCRIEYRGIVRTIRMLLAK